MMYARAIGATLLLCCQLSLAPGQPLAQPKAEEERVDVIVSQPESAGQPPPLAARVFLADQVAHRQRDRLTSCR